MPSPPQPSTSQQGQSELEAESGFADRSASSSLEGIKDSAMKKRRAERCRGRVKIIAITDIVVCVIQFVNLVYVAYRSAIMMTRIYQSPRVPRHAQQMEQEMLMAKFGFVTIVLSILLFICYMIELCMAKGLLKAVNPNTPVKDALWKVRFWFYYNSVPLFLELLLGSWTVGTGLYHSNILMFPIFLLRVLGLIIVHDFKKDLRLSLGNKGVAPVIKVKESRGQKQKPTTSKVTMPQSSVVTMDDK